MRSESSPISIKYMMKMLIILGILRNEIMNIVKCPVARYKQKKCIRNKYIPMNDDLISEHE